MNKKRLICILLCSLLVICQFVGIFPGTVTDAEAYSLEKPIPTLTGDKKADIIAIAKSQVGYTEDETGTVYGDWYKKINNSSYDFTTAPWCAMFISWCANKAGISSDIIPCTALAKQSASTFKAKGCWKEPKSYVPQVGDMIYFTYGDSEEINHMGLVTAIDNGYVAVCEGNKTSLNGGVGISNYRMNNTGIVGYASPNYNGMSSSSTSPSPTVTPTSTAKPTATVAPTSTIKPTATVAPTSTAKPTATVAPTSTAKPTATVAPTSTVKPTATVAPIGTAKPTTENTVLVVSEPNRVLRLGAKGEDVKWLQYILNKLGKYNIKIDGVMGSNTVNIVKKVQANLKLTVDGVVGNATINAMKNKLGIPTRYILVDKKTNSAILLRKTTGVTAKQYKYNQIKLTWGKVAGATGYLIYKYDTNKKKYVKYKMVNNNSYIDCNLTPNVAYYYKIVSYKKIEGKYCFGMYSDAVKCVARPAKVVANVKAKGNRSIIVSWVKQNDVSGYEVYRSLSKNGKYTLRKTITDKNRTYFINTGLQLKSTYYYRVRSYKVVKGVKVYGGLSNICTIKVLR